MFSPMKTADFVMGQNQIEPGYPKSGEKIMKIPPVIWQSLVIS